MADPIPLFEITWDEMDVANAVKSIARGGYWAKGPFVDQFETELKDHLGAEHAVVVNSGTTALVAALRAAGVGPGDEVIVPSLTFIATANAVRLVGAEPVFADVETETYGLDPDSVREQVSDETAAVVPAHLYGAPCRIEELVDVAEAEDLVLVEDAAEAYGATYEGEYVGTFGDAGVMSFCQNKVVVTGEGGAVVTDDGGLAAEIRRYRSHGRAEGDYFDSVGSGDYLTLGTNIRMSDLTAAVGCAQLAKVDDLVDGRRAAAARLNEALADVEGVRIPRPREGGTHVYQLYTVELDPDIDRERVVKTLADCGVSSKIYWDTPVHRTGYYRESYDRSPDLPRTEALTERVLSLPMYPNLSRKQTDRIAAALVKGLERAR